MPAKTIYRRMALWMLTVLVIALLLTFMHGAKIEWSSEAIVQALAGLGGLAYWASRSRSRVTLRLGRRMADQTFLDIENVGNRIARQVQVKCEPPIEVRVTRGDEEEVRQMFGPVEDFGDMDGGQRYSVMVNWKGREFVGGDLTKITFEVSHESTFGIRRRKSKMQLGGGGVRRASVEEASTPLGRIASATSQIAGNTRSR